MNSVLNFWTVMSSLKFASMCSFQGWLLVYIGCCSDVHGIHIPSTIPVSGGLGKKIDAYYTVYMYNGHSRALAAGSRM